MLASCSNGLNVFEYNNNELKEVFRQYDVNEPNEKLNGLSWNHTNQVIAIGGSGRKARLIQASNGAILSTIPFTDLSNIEYMDKEIGAISFSSNSRYLATGTGSNIEIWDLKNRTIRSQFTSHKGNINSLLFFPDGNIIAGDITGSIRIWDVKNETSSGEMNYNKISLKCLELSPQITNSNFKIAAGYDDGSIVVWDASSLKNIRHQIVHKGIVMDLSYSPKNPRLVATAGFDGRLSLVDTASKTNDPSAFIDVGDRLTCVSFHEDAIHCAVGTNSGDILIYDWRNVRKPVCKIEAHNPYPVRALQFQLPIINKPLNNDSKNVISSKTSESSVNMNQNLNNNSLNIKKDSVNSTLPPPISISTAPPIPPEISNTTKILSIDNNPKVRTTSESNITRTSLSTLSIDSDMQNVNIKSNDISNRNIKDNSKVININNSTDELKSDTNIEEMSKIFEIEEKRNKSIGYLNPNPNPNSNKNITIDTNSVDEFDSLRKSVKAVTSQEMNDALQMLKYDIHKEMQEIIKEQSRQFSIAKDDMTSLIEKMNKQIEDLLLANKELRSENEKLRRIF